MEQSDLDKAITGISHSGFYVEDLDRTIDFYTKVFGAKLAWRNDKGKNPLIKMYVGEFGLSIIKWPDDMERIKIPHAIHWSYQAVPEKAEEVVEYIKSIGIPVEGPVGHRREKGYVNWFFLDPDGYRVEIEARYPSAEEAEVVLERGKDSRHEEMGLYAGDTVLHTERS